MNSRGFTLIEIVVALTVLSLVMLATITGLRTFANTQTRVLEQAGRNDELRAVSSLLRDALASTVLGENRSGLSLGGGLSNRTVFAVYPEALVWKTAMLIGERQGGTRIVRVARESSSLVLRWAGDEALRADFDWNSAASRTLLDEVQEFSVAYRREATGDWAQRWDRGDAPGWVRMRIRARQRYWPDLVVRVPG